MHRDLGGIGSRGLYTYSRHGTKQLILDYVEEVCEQLRNVMVIIFPYSFSFSFLKVFHSGFFFFANFFFSVLIKTKKDSSYFSLEQKFDFFYETRQSYGRTALLLSGGAALGMYHLGVVKVSFSFLFLLSPFLFSPFLKAFFFFPPF